MGTGKGWCLTWVPSAEKRSVGSQNQYAAEDLKELQNCNIGVWEIPGRRDESPELRSHHRNPGSTLESTTQLLHVWSLLACKGDCLAIIGQNSVWVLGRTDAPDWYGQKRRPSRQCYLVSFGKHNTLQFWLWVLLLVFGCIVLHHNWFILKIS